MTQSVTFCVSDFTSLRTVLFGSKMMSADFLVCGLVVTRSGEVCTVFTQVLKSHWVDTGTHRMQVEILITPIFSVEEMELHVVNFKQYSLSRTFLLHEGLYLSI